MNGHLDVWQDGHGGRLGAVARRRRRLVVAQGHETAEERWRRVGLEDEAHAERLLGLLPFTPVRLTPVGRRGFSLLLDDGREIRLGGLSRGAVQRAVLPEGFALGERTRPGWHLIERALLSLWDVKQTPRS